MPTCGVEHATVAFIDAIEAEKKVPHDSASYLEVKVKLARTAECGSVDGSGSGTDASEELGVPTVNPGGGIIESLASLHGGTATNCSSKTGGE